jgi:glycine cleavage system H protein
LSESSVPNDRLYSADHEWVAIAPGESAPSTPVRVGVTAVAVAALGDLVYVDLPEVGTTVTAGTACGELESTKAVSDLVAPVSGSIVEINNAVVEDPGVVGGDPYGAGWLFAVAVTGTGDLLTAAEYAQQNPADG